MANEHKLCVRVNGYSYLDEIASKEECAKRAGKYEQSKRRKAVKITESLKMNFYRILAEPYLKKY